jgi:hypothetical protein
MGYKSSILGLVVPMGRPIYVKGKDSGLQPKVDAKLLHLQMKY